MTDYAPGTWQAKAIAMFAPDVSSTAIAAVVGVRRQTVAALRQKIGAAPFDMGNIVLSHFEPTPEQLADLRERSNREMSRVYGMSADTWRTVRSRHGIRPFREPTVIGSERVPNRWVERPVKLGQQFGAHNFAMPQSRFQVPARDCTIAGEAASFLRRDRAVFNRSKIGAGKGWQVGTLVMTEAEMIAKAEARGFRRQEWMGEAA